MKKIFLFIIGLMIAGCAYQGQNLDTYLENPETIIRDPHFAKYQEESAALEKEYYTEKKITYAEYQEKKNQLDQKYDQEVQQRNQKISSP